MAATVSGAVLSSLFFSQSNCKGDQEGLLFGQVIRQVRDTISDSQINNYQVETKIYIYSCRDCTGPNSFHDNRCHIKESYIEELRANNNKVVGWYRFRRNSSARISMKETCLHKNLLKSLPRDIWENVLFFQCTVSPSGNMATHNFDYNLYKWSETNNRFFKVPLNVVNLGDTTHTLYRLERSCTVSPECGAFITVIAKYQNEMLDEAGRGREIQNITALTNSLHSRLQELTKLVAESEQALQSIEEDVDKQRNILQSKLEEKTRNQQIPPSQNPPAASHAEDMLNQKSKVSNEDAIAIAKSKREQRRREGTKLTTSLHTGRSASAKSRSDLAGHHSRKLSGDTEYLDNVDVSRLDSLPESSLDTVPVGQVNVTNQTSGINDLLDLTEDNTDQIFPPMEPLESNSNIRDKNQDRNPTNNTTGSSSKSKEDETNLKSSNDPFSFVSDILKGANSKNQKHGEKDSMSLPTGGCIKMHNTEENYNGDDEELPQRKTRSQRSQKPIQSQNTRGQRSQIRQVQMRDTKSKNSAVTEKETVVEDKDSDSEIVRNSNSKNDVTNAGKLCRQQVTGDSVQSHLVTNTNSMHGTEEFIGDVEMTNVTENDFEISSSPVF